MRLKSKVALITGAGTGIGAATAELFAKEGADLILAGLIAEDLETVSANLKDRGCESLVAPVDISDEAQVKALFEASVRTFGRLDILFNNAGVGGGVSDILRFEESNYYRIMDTNLKGVMLCCKYALPIMIKQGYGVIINNASIMGILGVNSSPIYGPSKAAVLNLTQSLALEHASQGIRINAVSPGWIATPLTAKAGPEKIAERNKTIPLGGRYADPIEVAYGVLFLSSDEASYITGVNLPIDGGVTAGRYYW